MDLYRALARCIVGTAAEPVMIVAFRDLKCLRYGLGFELNLSRAWERLAALLLIAALAFHALWLIGSQALARGLLSHYQSNTRRSRPRSPSSISPFKSCATPTINACRTIFHICIYPFAHHGQFTRYDSWGDLRVRP